MGYIPVCNTHFKNPIHNYPLNHAIQMERERESVCVEINKTKMLHIKEEGRVSFGESWSQANHTNTIFLKSKNGNQIFYGKQQ